VPDSWMTVSWFDKLTVYKPTTITFWSAETPTGITIWARIGMIKRAWRGYDRPSPRPNDLLRLRPNVSLQASPLSAADERGFPLSAWEAVPSGLSHGLTCRAGEENNTSLEG